jgi:hypothetical protein
MVDLSPDLPKVGEMQKKLDEAFRLNVGMPNSPAVTIAQAMQSIKTSITNALGLPENDERVLVSAETRYSFFFVDVNVKVLDGAVVGTVSNPVGREVTYAEDGTAKIRDLYEYLVSVRWGISPAELRALPQKG